jgi:hypothetical protein
MKNKETKKKMIHKCELERTKTSSLHSRDQNSSHQVSQIIKNEWCTKKQEKERKKNIALLVIGYNSVSGSSKSSKINIWETIQESYTNILDCKKITTPNNFLCLSSLIKNCRSVEIVLYWMRWGLQDSKFLI